MAPEARLLREIPVLVFRNGVWVEGSSACYLKGNFFFIYTYHMDYLDKKRIKFYFSLVSTMMVTCGTDVSSHLTFLS